MEFRDGKWEALVTVGAIALLFGMIALFKSFDRSTQNETVADIIYEMPRPVKSELENEFTLGDREVIRNYIHEKEKSVVAKNEKSDGRAKPPPKKANAAKAKAASAAKKPEVAVRVVGERPSSTATWNDDYQSGSIQVSRPQADSQRQDTKPEDENVKVKSFEEWQSLLASQPTKQNVTALLVALRNKEVNYNEFYQLIQEMMATKKPEAQSSALYALQVVPNGTSFAIIAKNYAILTAENRPQADVILLSYSQPAKLAYLGQALQSQDLIVVQRAAVVITAGLERAKQGQTVDPRNGRGGPYEIASVEPYGRFVPLFEHWRQSGEPNRVDLAIAFLTRWGS